jgi:predicted DNA-binding protein (MmcQ/YjbR family)
MNIESLREYCLSKKEVTDGTPFGPDVLVFKVCNKMFALCDIQSFESINLKCEPEYAVELRERYQGITPGYHMNKLHWNTVMLDGSVPWKLVMELIDHSYELVVSSLPKKVREGM